MFTIPPKKNYKEDIRILHDKIKSGEHISFSKFCDGEWAILNNEPIDNKEFRFNPNDKLDQEKRQLLLDAFTYDNPRYYIGITCVKVFGLDVHRKMKLLSNRKEDKITWADIWVNSNYKYYIENILPIYGQRNVVLFCNKKANISNLPFNPVQIFYVENNAWNDSFHILQEAKDFVLTKGVKDHIFLFCCGPFGNILCHQLTESNPNNIYLDIGSTLNPLLKSAGFERDYYMGDNFFSRLEGEWDQ